MWPFKSKKQKIKEDVERITCELKNIYRELEFLEECKNKGWPVPSSTEVGYRNSINLLKAKLIILESEIK